MSFAICGAVVVGVGSVAFTVASAVGSLAAGAAGLGVSAATGLVTGVGSLAGGALGTAGSLASGAGSLIFGGGGQAAGTTVGEGMAAIAQPAFYETAATGAGVLGGVASAASTTAGYLGDMAPMISGIYSMMNPPKKSPVTTGGSMPSGFAPVTSKGITPGALPVFSQSPQVRTVGGPAAETSGSNYMIYIAIAVVAFILLRKK